MRVKNNFIINIMKFYSKGEIKKLGNNNELETTKKTN